MEILMEGQLERCILAPGNDAKREWKKGYCVFRKHAKNGSKMLEFYKDSNWRRTEPKGVCNLFSDYTVDATSGQSKRKFVFLLKTAEQSYEFSANSQVLCQKWIDTLSNEASQMPSAQTMTVIKSFNVVLLNEEHVRKILNTFSGVCQLVVTDAEVILMVDGHHKVKWKFAMIRRYKSQRDTFVIEVGRKAPTGEGEFRFETVKQVELFDVIDKAVKDRMKAKGIEITTAPPPANIKLPNSTALKSPKDENFRYFPSPHLPLPPTPTALNPPHARPTVENEYSHLNNTQAKTPAVQNNSEYDHLYNRDRMVQQRRSEPAALSVNALPQHLNNNRPLTGDSLGSKDCDDYEEMNSNANQRKLKLNNNNNKPPDNTALKHEKPLVIATTPERKPRPLPAPRIKASAKAPSPRSELRKSYSSPLVESKPDSAPTSPTKVSNEQTDKNTDYDMLFSSSNNNETSATTTNTDTSEYSHLAHNGDVSKPWKHPQNQTNDELYDIPKTPKSPPTRKAVTRPCRPAPLPPTKPNAVATKQGGIGGGKVGLSSSAGANDSIISQLQKRNKDIAAVGKGAKITRGASQDLYDSPAQQPVGYNQVGELIPGEYHRSIAKHSMDSDGYVKVPESETTEDIYQVPKGE